MLVFYILSSVQIYSNTIFLCSAILGICGIRGQMRLSTDTECGIIMKKILTTETLNA